MQGYSSSVSQTNSSSPSIGALNSEGTPTERSRLPPLDPSSGGKKRKTPSNKSPLWEYFTRVQIPGTDSIDPSWCKCNVCDEKVLCETKKNGTSSMWAHTRKCATHPLRHDVGEVDPKQSKLCGSTMSAGGYHKFSKKRCDDRCIDMIIMDELPFRFVQKDGFRAFCKELEPNWTPLDRRQIAKGVLDKFNSEKALLLSQLKENNTRVSNRYVSLIAKNFEIHKWWKGNESTYPVLSKLAKDIFAIPCSTVASENAFSLGSRVVDPFRASLTPKTVEALVCTADWLRASPPNFNLYEDPTEEALQIYSDLEELERENAYNQGYEGTSNNSGQTNV